MKQIFSIPGRLPGMNEIVNAARHNRFAGAKQKRDETERCALWAMPLKPFNEPVRLSIRWIEPNMRRDVDNISGGGTKFILDGLVAAGKLPNDSRRWVTGIFHEFPNPDKKNPRVVIIIETVMGSES
jgi:hypothetical protein